MSQLESARGLALDSRRRQQKQRLEVKLEELRRVMAGISDDHLARICVKMMGQEEDLRGKQNTITTQINDNLEEIRTEMSKIRAVFEKITVSTQRTPNVQPSQARTGGSYTARPNFN